MENTDKLIELKKALELGHVVEITPTKFKVAIFNFAHGNCDLYDFVAEYISKLPYGSYAGKEDYSQHVVYAYGVMKCQDGCEYKSVQKLTYTDFDEIDKILSAVKEGTDIGCGEDVFEKLRKY